VNTVLELKDNEDETAKSKNQDQKGVRRVD
jgi:hypothetical protein